MRVLELTDEQLQILANLLDSGIRYDGLKSVHNASVLLRKIETAEEVKEKPCRSKK